jgi:uncharacterized protein YlxP (DUF503 family)
MPDIVGESFSLKICRMVLGSAVTKIQQLGKVAISEIFGKIIFVESL